MRHRSMAAALALAVCAYAVPTQAATREWRGTGADQLWSNPDNWVLNVVPVDGDDLVFPATAEPITSTNDLTNLHVRSFTIGSARTFTGNAIRLQAGLTIGSYSSMTPVTFEFPVQLTGHQTWTVGSASIVTSADFVLEPTATLDLNGSTLTIDVPLGAWASLEGTISGTGGLIKNGIGRLALNGHNTYAGPTTLNAGYISAPLTMSLGIGDGTTANGTTSAANTVIGLGPGVYGEAFQLSGRLGGASDMDTEITSPMTITGEAFLLGGGHVVPTARLIVSGVISGSGRLRLGGSHGKVTLRRTNTYSGGTVFDPAVSGTTSDVRVEADEAIGPAPTMVVDDPIRIYIDTHTQTLGDTSDDGTITLISSGLPAERATLIFAGAGDAVYRGAISGDGLIRHTGAGRQELRDALATLAATSAISVEHGILEVNSHVTAPASVIGDGRLVLSKANGSYGPLTMTSGTMAFAALAAQTPALSAADGTVEFRGTGNQIARISVFGPTTLTNSTLVLSVPDSFTTTIGALYPLVDKVPAGPVTGTFLGLPEGAEVRSGRFAFRISYVGGNGNDVVLTVTKVSRELLLSEGATGGFFSTDILIANPTDHEVPATVQFFPTGGAPISMNVTMPALSRKTIRANDVAGLSGAEFSTLVTSIDGSELVVERTMTWDATGYGSHTDHAAEALSTTWYFAEGSQGFFQTYLLLANPQPTANTATVEYLRTDEPSITRVYDLTPNSRRTIDISQDSALVNRSFGMIVTFAQPGMAERSMYFGTTPFFSGGHASAGVTDPSPTWFVPEGATGGFFETFILLANPGTSAVDATVTFLPADGNPVTVQAPIAVKGRTTLNIEQQHASLANAAVATQVSATGPVLVERAQYWPDPAPNWYEAHNSFGVTSLATRWGLAEGRVGTTANYQTFILLANPGSTTAQVVITFLRDGQPSVQKVFHVPPTSRFNVQVAGPGSAVPELQNETFGALIVSSQPIAAERAMYHDANGVVWAAGSSATAVRLFGIP